MAADIEKLKNALQMIQEFIDEYQGEESDEQGEETDEGDTSSGSGSGSYGSGSSSVGDKIKMAATLMKRGR